MPTECMPTTKKPKRSEVILEKLDRLEGVLNEINGISWQFNSFLFGEQPAEPREPTAQPIPLGLIDRITQGLQICINKARETGDLIQSWNKEI